MKTWMANLLGVGVAGATLAGGLVLGAPNAEATGPAHPATIAAPAATGNANAEVNLAESMVLAGRPTRLTMFWTTDDTDQIIDTYADAWKNLSNPPLVKKMDRVTSISVLEPESGLMRSVSVTDMGDERVVVPSVTDVRAFPDLSARKAPLPIPENARAYLGQVADDTNAVSFHASFLLPLSPARAKEFYDVELGKLGYKAQPGMLKSSAKAVTGEWTRGPETVTFVATHTEDSSANTAFVIVEHVRAITGEGE